MAKDKQEKKKTTKIERRRIIEQSARMKQGIIRGGQVRLGGKVTGRGRKKRNLGCRKKDK